MALLTDTLTRNQVSPIEDNLDKGMIYTFHTGNQYAAFINGIMWRPPGCGKAIIETWGAGGSGARQCCCGSSIPGNPGAYVKKVVCMTPSNSVCGQHGMSCGNAGAIFYRGRSEPSGVCWCGIDMCGNTNGCLCAEGGYGGASACQTAGGSPYCCFLGNGFCGSQSQHHGVCCGIICNMGCVSFCGARTAYCALAYGGDINCWGGFSCANFFHAEPNYFVNCYSSATIAVPPGIIADGRSTITFKFGQAADGHHNWSGEGLGSSLYAINAASKWPTQGIPWTACWVATRMCGCYEDTGCNPIMPYGFPGVGASVCADVRSHGYRGGHGAIRIKFICCNSCFFSCNDYI